jgi:hypothetical protein
VVIQPTKRELDDPYIGPKLEEALRGSEISARDRIKIFRQISERFLTEWGARHEMFEKFNGTPLYLINLLTMQRTEYQVDGPRWPGTYWASATRRSSAVGRRRRSRRRTMRTYATNRSTPVGRTCTTATSVTARKRPPPAEQRTTAPGPSDPGRFSGYHIDVGIGDIEIR